MSDHALIVPVRVTALMVNPTVRKSTENTFARWSLNFSAPFHQGPEPLPGNPPLGGAPSDGVLLHWEPPRALRDTDPLREGDTRPLNCPDRWVVVRYAKQDGRRRAKAWLIQSDALRRTEDVSDDSDNSPYGMVSDTKDGRRIDQRRIGRRWELTEDITEPSMSEPLTAFGPGVPAFSVYQPYNLGVFSMHDDLAGLSEGPDGIDLSYQIFGWYGSIDRDPLSRVAGAPHEEYEERLRELLDRLRWRYTGPITGTMRSVHAGSVHGLVWRRHGEGEGDEKPRRDDKTGQWVDLSLGTAETSSEGLSALAQRIPDIWPDERPDERAEYQARLQALQYGLLDEYDAPGGRAEVARKAHEARFEPVAGGHVWDFVSGQSDQGEPAPPPDVPRAQADWLKTLNADQEAYDTKLRELTRLQERLRTLWGYREHAAYLGAKGGGAFGSTGSKKMKALAEKISPHFDPARSDSLAERIERAQDVLRECRALVRETDPERIERAITDELRGLEELLGHEPVGVLTRFPREPFHRPTEPVVLLRGAGTRRLLEDRPGELTCRGGGQTVTKMDGAASAPVVPDGFATILDRPGWKGVFPTDLHKALLAEFTALDDHRSPQDTTTVSFADEATAVPWSTTSDPRVAALRFQTEWWRQPWTPLYLCWSADYYPVPYEDRRPGHEGERNWVFDGRRYLWRGEGHVAKKGDPPPFHTVNGRILLSPHAVHNLADRYRHLKDAARGQDPAFLEFVSKILENFNDAEKGTDLVSQALDGFSAQLTGRESLLRPTPELKKGLVSPDYAYEPRLFYTGSKPKAPKDPDDPENWIRPLPAEGLRAGQFVISRLMIIDRYGRACAVDTEDGRDRPDLKVELTRSATVTPDDRTPGSGKADATVLSGRTNKDWSTRVMQLRPRFPQPARLRFEALSRGSDTEPPVRPVDGDQIRGWVVPDHLDQGVLCYTHDGVLLGELRDADGDLVWEDAGSGLTPDPELVGFLDGIKRKGRKGPAALAAFLQAEELARLTTSPDRTAAGPPTLRLLGRPMALVRARLTLEPDAGAIVPVKLDRLTAIDPRPAYMDHTWPVLLGSDAAFGDGLVGYFQEKEYDTFYAVSPPEERGGYVADRNLGSRLRLRLNREESVKVSMLLDPWASVHATTHVVPTSRLRLEPEAVADALGRMEALFHVGPSLGGKRPVTVEHGGTVTAETTAFPMPLPKVEHGTWSWVPAMNDRANPVPVRDDDGTARLTPEAPVHLRTGLLRLRQGFGPARRTSDTNDQEGGRS
ncbi:hypothetical protein ACFV4I_00075 [Nocardiopsis alba]|uniref:hypothetical protein n=1 Tax=Nocardiopsis alba TaxID=53437 RepID=UPI0036603532